MATIALQRGNTLPDSSAKSDFHNLIDLAKLTDGTQGDIIYYNGTNWVNLGYGTNGYYLKTQGAAANPVWAAVTNAPTRATFDDDDLSAGVLTITHNKGLSAPYSLQIEIFDNNAEKIVPDAVTGLTNTCTVDLTSYGTLSGTWQYAYFA